MPDSNDTQFRCTIKKMYNGCPKPDGWFGCFAHVRGSYEDIKLTGVTNVPLTAGMQLDVKTKWNDRYGSFEIIEMTIVTKTITGMKSYLKSVNGIGNATATALLNKYGTDVIEMIENNPDEVKKTIGISDKEMEKLIAHVNNTNMKNKVRKFLPELSPNLVTRVCDNLDDPIEAVKRNPYVLNEIQGITFPTADAIALRLGIAPFSKERIQNGILHVMESDGSGNLYTNLSDDNEITKFMGKVEKLLNIKFTGLAEFGGKLTAYASEKDSPIKIEHYDGQYHLYLTKIYDCMETAAVFVWEHKGDDVWDDAADVNVPMQILRYERQEGKRLTPEQKTAAANAMSNKITVVSGGPGRGKTFMMDCIASLWPDNRKVLLLAPTGRAVNKLRNDTHSKYASMTIDRLIVQCMLNEKFNTGKKKKTSGMLAMNKESTLIIIDESSMLDIEKAAGLVKIMDKCHYVFVGDVDQLPPIGAGNFLKDLIKSGTVPVTYLTKSMRNRGVIRDNAELINKNDTNLMYNFTEMPFYPQADDDEAALDAVIDQYNDERIDCPDVTKIALISPVRKGILGVSNLNMTLQDIVCPASMNNAAGYNSNHKRNYHANKGYQIMSTIYGNSERYTRFRVGDTVMCTKNNSCIETFKYKNDDYWNGSPESTEMGIFNGDQGKIIGYIEAKDSNDEHEIIVIQFFNNMIAEIDLTAGDFDSFELGYAMTVHKAQGCEYDTVVYVSPKSLTGMTSGGFATKNLVYTAVTRAKKRVVIMGSKESLNNCIMTNAVERHSNLAERMK